MSTPDAAGLQKSKSTSDEAVPESLQPPAALRRGRSVAPRQQKSTAPSGVKQPVPSAEETQAADAPPHPAPVPRKGASTIPRRPSAEEPSAENPPPAPVPVVRKGASTVPRRPSTEEPSAENPLPAPVVRKGASTVPRRPSAEEPSAENPLPTPVLRKGASTVPKRNTTEEPSTDIPTPQVPVVRKGASTAPAPGRRSSSEEETPPVIRKGPSVKLRHKSSTAPDFNSNEPKPVVMPRVKMSSVPGDPVVEDGTDSQSDKLVLKPRQVPSIFMRKNDKIPETYFKTVDLKITLDPKDLKDLDILLSSTLVLRLIGKGSPFFCYFVVGDQVLEINGSVPLTPDEAYRLLKKGSTFKIRLIRPWNIRACGKDRKPTGIKRDSSYQIVEVHKIAGTKNGFEIKGSFGKCMIGKVDPGTRGAHAFLKNDRILDCESQVVGSYGDLQAVRKRFTTTVNTNGVCSFLIERPVGLRSSPNPSLCAARLAMHAETDMGDDACEIGAREATRWKTMKDKYHPKSILKDHMETVGTQGPTMEMDNTEEERNMKKGKQTPRKKNKRVISIDNRNEISKMPSDVKDVAGLQRVTAKSGIIGFVRNYLSK